MTLRHLLLLTIGIIGTAILPANCAAAGDLMFGCLSRPACGKVCQLVCEPKKLTAVGYGYECKDICIPCPSRRGCKHCEVCCGECACGDKCGCCTPAGPACKFCWHDWFACGCAQPRTVKVLTKYQCEKKIDWYHWKVVDGSCCNGAGCCDVVGSNATGPAGDSSATLAAVRFDVYKPAPSEAIVGDTFEITDEERPPLARWTGRPLLSDLAVPAINAEPPENRTPQTDVAVQQASATEPADSSPAWRGFSRWLGLAD